MMTKPNDLAFPHADVDHPNQPGLTKREWFAGLAMGRLMAGPEMDGHEWDYASVAVTFADALIAELAKGEGK